MKVALLLLAAGRSQRMGAANKLLQPLGNATLLEASAAAFKHADFTCRYLVVGHEGDIVARTLKGMWGFEPIINPKFQQGMGTSIAAGATIIRSQTPDIDGVMIALGDMPLLKNQTVEMLLMGFEQDPAHVVRPVFEGKSGHPVIFPAIMLDALCALNNDNGARTVIEASPGPLKMIPSDDEGCIIDVDTPQVLEEVRRLKSQIG